MTFFKKEPENGPDWDQAKFDEELRKRGMDSVLLRVAELWPDYDIHVAPAGQTEVIWRKK